MSRNVYNSPSNSGGSQNQNDGTGGFPEGWQRSSSPSDNLPPELTREEMREQQRIENQIREDRRRRFAGPSNGQAGGTEQQLGNGAGAFDRSVRQRTSSLQQYHLNSEPNGPILVNQDLNPIGDQNDMRQDARSNNVQNQESFNQLSIGKIISQTEERQQYLRAMQQHQQAMQQHQQAMQQHQQAMQHNNHQIQEVLNETREILNQIQGQANRPSTPIGHINRNEAPSTPPDQIVPIRAPSPIIPIDRNPEHMGMLPKGGREDN